MESATILANMIKPNPKNWNWFTGPYSTHLGYTNKGKKERNDPGNHKFYEAGSEYIKQVGLSEIAGYDS